MRYILILVLLLSKNIASAQSGNSSKVPDHTSAQGIIQIPSLQCLNIELLYNSDFSFSSSGDLDKGKLIARFLKATVISNKPWILNVMTSSAYFYSSSQYNDGKEMPVSIMSIKAENSHQFHSLSNAPQPVLFSTNNNLVNTHYIDLKLNPGWSFPGGQYNTNVIFTLTAE